MPGAARCARGAPSRGQAVSMCPCRGRRQRGTGGTTPREGGQGPACALAPAPTDAASHPLQSELKPNLSNIHLVILKSLGGSLEKGITISSQGCFFLGACSLIFSVNLDRIPGMVLVCDDLCSYNLIENKFIVH